MMKEVKANRAHTLVRFAMLRGLICCQYMLFFGDAMRIFFSEYQKNQSIHNIFLYETFNMANYGCSNCGANDKDRFYALFMNRFLQENPTAKINLLDIAPSPQLTTFLKNKAQINYRSMDLYMEDVDDKAGTYYQDGGKF